MVQNILISLPSNPYVCQTPCARPLTDANLGENDLEMVQIVCKGKESFKSPPLKEMEGLHLLQSSKFIRKLTNSGKMSNPHALLSERN